MPYYNLAQTYLRGGETKRAKQAIDAALRLEPDYPPFVALHGRILGEMGKISDLAVALVAGGFALVIVVTGYWYRKRGRL